ncbi:endonuclease NucS [Candidatus Woesearchaeota archaeon]|nr:endonuclease NucS [Candidatus Woesearchaeota archaeon]
MLELADYASLLQNALKKNEFNVFGCRCSIIYSGRAESYLPPGDRIVIIKSDNSLLVHQPEGNNPVNYMKPGSSHYISFDDGKYFLRSQNLIHREYMDIEIHEIYFFESKHLEDGQKIILTGTEKDMAKMLFDNPSLIESGFKPLSMEEQTAFGFIDLFGYDKENTLTVIECKRYAADFKAVEQLKRYVERIKQSKGLTFVRGILAAPKISPNAEDLLHQEGFSFVSVKPPKYLERYDAKQKTLDGF